jgi:SAM-dependent methyltransferase
VVDDMNDRGWSQGYVTDTSYADKFFRELSPVWLNYVAAVNGGVPRILDRPFTYLELGCGFGTSTVVNAAAFPQGEFHACDFIPAHIEGGLKHAAALGLTNVEFHESSFDRLLSLDLPAFDFIVLHGVYSWVGADARRAIRHIVRKTLKPGGLVYVSYNCLPGWSVEAPLRKLMLELAATAEGGTPERTEAALHGMQQLSRSRLRYFNANPSAAAAIDSYVRGPSNYLAHEFLNQTWEPFYSIDVADEMAEAETRYLGSATLVDNHPTLVVDALASEAVATLATPRQRQLAIDFATNQRFRRDVFVRDGAPIGLPGSSRHLHAMIIGSLANPEAISAKVKVPRGEIRFQEQFIRDLRSLMAAGSMTIGDALTALGGAGRNGAEITRNLIFLVAAGTLMPFARAAAPAVRQSGQFGNPMVARVLSDAIERRARRAMPSQILGNGVEIRPIEAVALSEWIAGAASVEMLTSRLEAAGKRLALDPSGDLSQWPGNEQVARPIREIAVHVIENLVPTFTRLHLIV